MAGRSFELQRELGDGAFGTVYLADLVSLGGFRKAVAIKLLKPDWDAASDAARRLRDEARLLGRLRHRHIVQVDDLIRLDGRWAVVMEYVPGIDLEVLVQGARDQARPVPVVAALEITAAVAQALDAAWNGAASGGGEPLRVVHRDIKPSNVRLTAEGDVKVLDFGIARADFQGREARTDRVRYGSIGYMSPERLLGDPEVPAGDVYAVGVVLYELLTLEPWGRVRLAPEKAAAQVDEHLARARELLGPGLDPVLELIRACVAYEPEARPSARDVAEQARLLARGQEGADLYTYAAEAVPTLQAEGARVEHRLLTEEHLDSSTFALDGALPEAAPEAAPLPPAPARPVTQPTLELPLPAEQPAARRQPWGLAAAALLVAVGLGAAGAAWLGGGAEVPDPAAGVPGAGAPVAAMTGAGAGEGEATAGEGEATAGEGEATAGEGEATAGEGEATAGEGEATAGEGEATAGEATEPSAAEPSAAEPSAAEPSAAEPSAATAAAAPASAAAAPSAARTTTADAPAAASAARVDRAKFFVPGASRVSVRCAGSANSSTTQSVQLNDFPGGACTVEATVDGADLAGRVTVTRPAGYTCTPSGSGLSCARQ